MDTKKRRFWITLLTLSAAIILLSLLRDYRKLQKYKLPKQRAEAHAVCQDIAMSIVSFVAEATGSPAQEVAVERLKAGNLIWWESSFADTSLKRADPWNNEYIVKVTGEMVMVSSLGPDGMAATSDDITEEGPIDRK